MKKKAIHEAKTLFLASLKAEECAPPSTREGREASVYTRVLLAQAYEREGDLASAVEQASIAAEEARRLGVVQGSAVNFTIHSFLQRNCAEVGGEASLAAGLASTALLKPGLLAQDSFDMARVCMVESSIHRQLGNLPEARDACQEAVAAGMATGSQPGGFRKFQDVNESVLREIRLELGEIDLVAEAAEEQRRALAREKRAKRGARIRLEQSRAMDGHLAALAEEVDARRTACPRLCRAPGDEEDPGSRLPWGSLPPSLLPSWTEDGGLSHDVGRVARKQWQLESLFTILARVVAHIEENIHTTETNETKQASMAPSSCSIPPPPPPPPPTSPSSGGGEPAKKKPKAVPLASRASSVGSVERRDLGLHPLHIVDFGSGSGNSVLAFAALLPQCRFTLVDNNPFCAELGEKRVVKAGLRNVRWCVGDVADFTQVFDIGMATHLCGGATDVAEEKAIGNGAVFVLTPCCMGKIRHSIKRDYQSVHQQRREEGRTQILPQKGAPPGVLAEGIYGDEAESSPAAGAVVDQDRHAAGEEEDIEGSAGIVYPRSGWLRGQLGLEDYLEIIRLSDHSSLTAGDAYTASKRLMDADRCTVAAEAGYETLVGNLWPLEASPKNDVLVGAPGGMGLARGLAARGGP